VARAADPAGPAPEESADVPLDDGSAEAAVLAAQES